VVVAPPSRARDGDVARLSARLRQREATLIVAGDWPQVEATLAVARSGWEGLGTGNGYLSSRRVTVESAPRGGSGPRRTAELWLPAVDESFRVSAPTRLEAVS
jgi:hypothetical protein